MYAPAIREELRDMARRLATSGYYVMLPNMYYRKGAMELGPINPDPESPERKRMFELMHSLSIPLVMDDTKALLDFATTQAAYEPALRPCLETLHWLEGRLSQSRFLFGEKLTEADIRLFTTLVRFDSVYHGHFKCNIRRIVDYRNLWAYTRDIFQLPGIAETVDLGHIKRHYYMSHRRVNPTGIVPAGPALDFLVPADRDRGVDKLIVF
jgi:hypothetical protein